MNLDKDFCASPQCKNECLRQFTHEVKKAFERISIYKPIYLAYFCGEPEILINKETK